MADEPARTEPGTELVPQPGQIVPPADIAPAPAPTRRPGMVRAAAFGGAGLVTGLALATILPGRSRGRVIVAPGSRKRRKLRARRSTSVLVDLHLIDR